MYQPATANHLALLEHLTAIEGSAVKRHALWIAEQIAHLAGTPEDAVNYRTLLSEIRTIAELPPHEQTPRANATWCITWAPNGGPSGPWPESDVGHSPMRHLKPTTKRYRPRGASSAV